MGCICGELLHGEKAALNSGKHRIQSLGKALQFVVGMRNAKA